MASVSNSCPFSSEMCEETLERKNGEGRCVSKNEARRVHRYEKIIAARRAKRKEKKRNRKARLAQSKLFNGSRENAHSDVVRLSKRLEKEAIQKRLLEARGTTPRVCIDLGLTDLMSDKVKMAVLICVTASFQELNKLSSQLRRLYGSNRHSSKPLHLYFTNFAPSCRLYRMCVMKNEGFRNYMVEMTSENHAELFSRDSLVYLSPDAPESLPGTPLDPSKVYVIGGLVDETVHKLVSLERAQSEGVRSARTYPNTNEVT
uniref:SAM-dependent MTase TRM10-type domain-containing protein n=1 Tax=Ixodes ricinus TaxID=34613 RepID=V5IHX4_IXORI